jgi:hypothetical protein
MSLGITETQNYTRVFNEEKIFLKQVKPDKRCNVLVIAAATPLLDDQKEQ